MYRLALHRPLLAGLVTALLIWAFLQISSEMVEGDTRAFDVAVLRAAQSFRVVHTCVAEVMRDLSGLVSTTVLTLFTVVAFGYLAVVRARLMALLMGLSRIALGVHWATDVVAGWAFGAAWALAWLLLAHGLMRRPPGRIGGDGP